MDSIPLHSTNPTMTIEAPDYLESINNISTQEPKYTDDNTWKIVIGLIICTIGLLGNVIVISIIFILKEFQKNITHWYVLQLAIADSIFLLTLPFKISEILNHSWIYPEWMCKMKESILFFNFYASILFLMAMSIDRYIAICHTFSNFLQKFRSKEAAIVITIVMWTIALLLCIPVMLYSLKTGTKPNCKCSYEFPSPPITNGNRCIYEDFSDDESYNICLRLLSNPSAEVMEMSCRESLQLYHKNDHEGSHDYQGSHYYEGSHDYESSYDYKGSYDNESPPYYYYSNSGYDYTTDDVIENTTFHPINNISGFNENTETHYNGATNDCHYWDKPTGWKALLIFNFTVMFLLPFAIMATCYGLIVRRVSNSRVRASRYSSSSSATHITSTSSAPQKRRKSGAKSESDQLRVTLMCGILVSSFVVCWLPFHAIHIAKLKGITLPLSQKHICIILPSVGTFFAYLSSALNPFLYSFLGSKFSKRWRSALMKSLGRRSSTSSSVFGSVRFMKTGARRTKASSSSHGPTVANKFNRNNISDVNYPLSEVGNARDDHKEGKYLHIVTTCHAAEKVEKYNSSQSDDPTTALARDNKAFVKQHCDATEK